MTAEMYEKEKKPNDFGRDIYTYLYFIEEFQLFDVSNLTPNFCLALKGNE